MLTFAGRALAAYSPGAALMDVWSGPVQAGFAAFSLALLTFCVWLVRSIIKLSQQTQDVVKANTEAITKQIDCLEAVAQYSDETRRNVERLQCILESRPCLLDGRKDAKEAEER